MIGIKSANISDPKKIKDCFLVAIFIMWARRDLNPQGLGPLDFKSSAYTNSATRPSVLK